MNMRESQRKFLFGAASLTALSAVLSWPAAAQPANSPAGAQPTSGGVEEILVVAQRRAENMQKVPVAITAITAEAAAASGIQGTADLVALVPGLRFDRQLSASTPFIRGVGTATGSLGTESPVATYVDDVYLVTPHSTLFDFNNISSISVLKGPQGTLFGRNATGGVIQVFTRDPSDRPEIDASFGYGNYDTITADLYGNMPITSKLAANVALHYRNQREGWGTNLNNGEDVFLGKSYGGRVKLQWKGENTTIRLAGDASGARDQQGTNLKPQPGTFVFGCNPPTPACRIGFGDIGFYDSQSLHAVDYTGGALAGNVVTTYPQISDYWTTYQQGGSLKINHDFGLAQFVSITAFRHTSAFFALDQDGVPVVTSDSRITTSDEYWTQEVQLLSPEESPLKWIVGGFYMDETAKFNPYDNRNFGRGSPGLPGNRLVFYGQQETTSWALFGQATTTVLENTNLTLGLRYTEDERTVSANFQSRNPADIVVSSGAVAPVTAKWPKLTYRIALDHQFTSDLMGYVSFNRGFKSGVYNLLVPPPGPAPTASAFQPQVAPEVLDAWELGFKSQFLDNRLRLNVAGFRYSYKNLQLFSVATGITRILNAASAGIHGVELEATYNPLDNLTFNVALTYQHGEYKSFPGGPHQVPRSNGIPVNCDNQPWNPSSPGNSVAVPAPGCDFGGNDTIRTPPFAATFGVSYTVPTNYGDWNMNVSANYTSKFYWEPDSWVYSDPTTLVNAALTWTSPNGRYDVRVWGKNLAGEKYYSYANSTAQGNEFSPAPPLTFGVTFGTHWGG